MTADVKSIKSRSCYFFNDIINIKSFDSSLLKIDKKSYKNINIYNIGYTTIKKIDDYENIRNVNPLHLMIGKVNGYIDEKNRSKYLVFDSADKSKEVLKKYNELWMRLKMRLRT